MNTTEKLSVVQMNPAVKEKLYTVTKETVATKAGAAESLYTSVDLWNSQKQMRMATNRFYRWNLS
jgi:hypothetical protein